MVIGCGNRFNYSHIATAWVKIRVHGGAQYAAAHSYVHNQWSSALRAAFPFAPRYAERSIFPPKLEAPGTIQAANAFMSFGAYCFDYSSLS